jgi:Phage protein (N4 Gp49/phage Sf6 gene 66) family
VSGAPKVTDESIARKIVKYDYLYHDTITICVITMANGFRFIGHSVPVHKDNYDPQIGRQISYDNAFQQIWSHEGYLLKERIFNGES